MVIQGGNAPIVVTFDEDISTISEFVASLHRKGRTLKKWEQTDMTVGTDNISLPLTEEETRDFPSGNAQFELKGLDSNGKVVFWDAMDIPVQHRDDREFDLVDEG